MYVWQDSKKPLLSKNNRAAIWSLPKTMWMNQKSVLSTDESKTELTGLNKTFTFSENHSSAFNRNLIPTVKYTGKNNQIEVSLKYQLIKYTFNNLAQTKAYYKTLVHYINN